jgi:glycogen debranching enzyme
MMGEELFSGWGLRTMAAGEAGYDPDSYHNGSIWPHDNAIIAHGLRRYGLLDEVNRVAVAILEAASHFDHRLPEVFVGYSRGEVSQPVELPRSCSPQAWAAGMVPLLVRAMLSVEPGAKSTVLTVESPI